MILSVKDYLHTNKTEPVRLCFTEIEEVFLYYVNKINRRYTS